MANPSSHTNSPDIQMVTFMIGREEYGVNVMDVREIIDMTEITRMANAPSHLEGIIDLRGSIVPIVCLRKRFGLQEIEEHRLSCVAVMDFHGQLTGFVVDEVSDVVRVARTEILPPLDAAGQPWIEGILPLGERLVVVMNLEHLA